MSFGIALTGAIAGLIYLIIIIVKTFLIPYINRRRAALRALGKDGIKILRHDKTARLAYRGIYALFKGNYPDAEDLLQQALANSEVRQNQKFCIEWLVKLYEATENSARLMWCFRKAAEYSPDDAEAQSRLGHAYFAEGNLDKAEYFFEQALRYDANNGYSYYNLVKIFLVRKYYEKARETLENLMRINENHPLAHAEYANYYAMRGESEKAREECKKAQLCGYKDPDELNRRINAMLSFEETKFSKDDLPSLYYKKAEAKGDKQ
ncbi:MAG: tetratricopeptide repeat protein [Oscillospiraceae bacterium]|nr:tetratricopeptide repeat protein [Oscillospiraceae bacterium]